MLLTPAQIKPKLFETRRNVVFGFFTRGGCVSCLCACLSTRLLPKSYQYPNLTVGADGVGRQLRRDKECPFSGVTKSDRVWRKVPESDARSVEAPLCPHPGRGHLHHPPPLLPCWLHDTDELLHTPSIAFRHLPPNSARIGYATEGALFISAQLSADAVSALRKVCGCSSALITHSA